MDCAVAVHTNEVLLTCFVVWNLVGVVITQSVYIKHDVMPKFIKYMPYNMACNKLVGLLKFHSL